MIKFHYINVPEFIYGKERVIYMGTTTLLNSISRSETYPKILSITSDKNKGKLTLKVTDWTRQMCYEVPSIKFNLYNQKNSVNVKYEPVCIIMNTYGDIVEDLNTYSKSVGLFDIPETMYISIEPLFDSMCIKAHNELVKNGIEEGPEWTKTSTFSIEVDYITE